MSVGTADIKPKISLMEYATLKLDVIDDENDNTNDSAVLSLMSSDARRYSKDRIVTISGKTGAAYNFNQRQREIISRHKMAGLHTKDDTGELEFVRDIDNSAGLVMSPCFNPNSERRSSAPSLGSAEISGLGAMSPAAQRGRGRGKLTPLESPSGGGRYHVPMLSPNTDRRLHETMAQKGTAAAAQRFKDPPIQVKKPEDKKYLTARGAVEQLSPRSCYINACFREGLNPRQLLASKITERQLNLQHQGLGDAMCSVFIKSFAAMRGVDSVNLADNNLTDAGLGPAITDLATVRKLRELDVSTNAFGMLAAQALQAWLQSTCSLECLSINKCGLEDAACLKIIDGLAHMRSDSNLTRLDMSHNKIGASEIVDAGGALAAWLRGKDCVIQNLDLSWNSFRKSSVQLCQALGANANTSLLNLNLSYNALGEAGGVALGAALIDNKTLKTLNVAHNNLNSIAAFTICVGIAENSTLESVVLDGNPIGETGLAAMMVIPLVRGTRVTVSAKQCNLTIRDSGNWFRFDNLPGVYVLKLDDPFERAIALMLLRLVAFHRSCTFTGVKYDKTGKIIGTTRTTDETELSGLPQPVSMDLKTALLDIRKELNEKQQEIAHNFEKLIDASEKDDKVKQAFQDADAGNKGALDKDDMERLLHTLGIELSAFRLGSLMATFDSDGNGAIDFEEFQAMLLQTKAEHQRHLSDLCCLPITSNNNNGNVDSSTATIQFIPKKQGSILMQVVDGRVHKPICHTLPSCNRTVLEDMAAHTPDPDLANRIGMKLTQVRVDDAISICNSLSKKQDRNKNDMVIQLCQQMASVEDCRLLISEVTGNDRVAAALLKRAMGACWYSTQGMLNGFYELDLSKKHDRECLRCLYSHSKNENNARAARSPLQYGLIGDVSQKGNWSSFRNEMFNQNPIVLNDEFVNEMPVLGQLQFDFSGEPRAEEVDGVPVVSVIKDVAVVELLVQLQLIKSSNSKGALEVLEEARALCNRCLRGDGHTVFETKIADAQEIGLCRSLFFENLGRRSTLLKNAARLEDIGAKADSNSAGPILGKIKQKSCAVPSEPAADASAGTVKFTGLIAAMNAAKRLALQAIESTSKREKEEKEREEERKRKQKEEEEASRPGMGKHLFNATEGQHFYGVVKPLVRQASISYLKSVTQKDDLTPQAKMRRVVDAIEDALGCYTWIRCRHLALLLACVRELPHGMCAKTKYFGNYRVDIVVMLFGHIVDRHNFQLVLRELTPFETACVSMRIGMLNYFNPMSPEGAQSMDLSHWDQRQLAKAYTMLVIHEPGDNWAFKQFKWTIDSPHIPGWVLTTGWVEEATMPTRGILDLSYYSGEGEGRHNCAPLVNFRKSLLYMTTLEEGQFKPELTGAEATLLLSEASLSPVADGSKRPGGSPLSDNAATSAPAHAPLSTEGEGGKKSAGLAYLLWEEEMWWTYLGVQIDPEGAKSVHAPRRKNKTGAGESSIPLLNLFASKKFTPNALDAEIVPINGSVAAGKMALRLSSDTLAPLKGNSHAGMLPLSTPELMSKVGWSSGRQPTRNGSDTAAADATSSGRLPTRGSSGGGDADASSGRKPARNKSISPVRNGSIRPPTSDADGSNGRNTARNKSISPVRNGSIRPATSDADASSGRKPARNKSISPVRNGSIRPPTSDVDGSNGRKPARKGSVSQQQRPQTSLPPPTSGGGTAAAASSILPNQRQPSFGNGMNPLSAATLAPLKENSHASVDMLLLSASSDNPLGKNKPARNSSLRRSATKVPQDNGTSSLMQNGGNLTTLGNDLIANAMTAAVSELGASV